jgi:hypothetical protein
MTRRTSRCPIGKFKGNSAALITQSVMATIGSPGSQSSMTMSSTQHPIVVFERQPFWEPELRRQFADGGATVRGCRTVADLDHLTSGNPRLIAVVNLEDAAADLLRWLSRGLTTGRQVPTIAVAGPKSMPFQWHAREAGVVAVLSREIGGHQLARLCRKQWSPASATEFD